MPRRDDFAAEGVLPGREGFAPNNNSLGGKTFPLSPDERRKKAPRNNNATAAVILCLRRSVYTYVTFQRQCLGLSEGECTKQRGKVYRRRSCLAMHQPSVLSRVRGRG
ncbi:hypothetical protein Bbelb_000950 [Branchiostoma belcheri]|nr:hypothetical protein Bbelb_000950 [Branchiostoma belcheri]